MVITAADNSASESNHHASETTFGPNHSACGLENLRRSRRIRRPWKLYFVECMVVTCFSMFSISFGGVATVQFGHVVTVLRWSVSMCSLINIISHKLIGNREQYISYYCTFPIHSTTGFECSTTCYTVLPSISIPVLLL